MGREKGEKGERRERRKRRERRRRSVRTKGGVCGSIILSPPSSNMTSSRLTRFGCVSFFMIAISRSASSTYVTSIVGYFEYFELEN